MTLTKTFRTSAVDATSASTYTFTAVGIGTASSTRRVVVGVTGKHSTAFALSTVTIGGVSATIHQQVGGSTSPFGVAAMASAVVPAGTTADIVVTLSTSIGGCGIGVWTLDGESSTVADSGTDVTNNPGSVTLTTASGDVVFAAAHVRSSATWTGATERYDQVTSSPNAQTGADVTATGTSTVVSVTADTSMQALAAVAFQGTPPPLSAAASATTDGAVDLVAATDTYGAVYSTPSDDGAGWYDGNGSTTVTPSTSIYLTRSGATASAAAEARYDTTLPAGTPRWFVATVRVGPSANGPIEAAIGWVEGTVQPGTPYKAIPSNGATVTLALELGPTTSTQSLRVVARSPYAKAVDVDLAVVSATLYDLGTVGASAFGNGAYGPTLPVVTRADGNAAARRVLIDDEDGYAALVSGTLTVTDYEAALTGDLTYTHGTDTATVTGDLYSTGPIVSRRGTTPDQVALALVTDYGSRLASRDTVHQVIGRDTPVVVSGGASTARAGTLEAYCDGYAAARALEQLLAAGGDYLLRQPALAGADMTFVPTRADSSPDPAETDPRTWMVRADYQETEWEVPA